MKKYDQSQLLIAMPRGQQRKHTRPTWPALYSMNVFGQAGQKHRGGVENDEEISQSPPMMDLTHWQQGPAALNALPCKAQIASTSSRPCAGSSPFLMDYHCLHASTPQIMINRRQIKAPYTILNSLPPPPPLPDKGQLIKIWFSFPPEQSRFFIH